MDWTCGCGQRGPRTNQQHAVAAGRKNGFIYWKPFNLLIAGLLAVSVGCAKSNDRPIGAVVEIKAPLGLPPVPIPSDNPPTAETIALGRRLFYDARLSRDESLSCASCHDERVAFSDEKAVSLGVDGTKGIRNAPTLLNSAYLPFQFWDGRVPTLEMQTTMPIQDHREMKMSPARLLYRLNMDGIYRAMAKKAFGSPVLNTVRMEKSIASFERTLLSGASPFDRFYFGGDKTALTPAQVRGLLVFEDTGRGNCAVCHTISKDHALFTDGKFHNLGIGVRDDETIADRGRFVQTGTNSDTGAFLTPTLRNVALTAPYMHDGSEKSLQEVVEYYAGHGNSNPYLDPEMAKIHLSGQDKSDLVEFLKSLTGTMPEQAGPPGKRVEPMIKHFALICATLAVAGCSHHSASNDSAGSSTPKPNYFHVDAATAGSITGVVHYSGPRPAPKLIDMANDPACVNLNKDKVYDESLKVSAHGGLGNAFVYVKSGLEGKTFEPPATPVTIDQHGCWFHPRVIGIQVGQEFDVTNSDPVTHNIHPMAHMNHEWNHSQDPGDPPMQRRFTKEEIMIPVKCNIHGWMHAQIGVVNHPYFAVSKEDGSFSIPNLPPGTYTLAIWHERMGTQEQQVTVPAHGETKIKFDLKAK